MDPDQWPKVAQESRSWRTNPDGRDERGRRPPRADRELRRYRPSVPPVIAERMPRLELETQTALADATAEVVRLEAAAAVELGALSGFLLRSEGIATSRIEQLRADPADLAAALVGAEATESATQIAAGLRMMQQSARQPAGKIVLVQLLDLHRTLMSTDPHDGRYAGVLRPVQNWIGGSDFSPRGAVDIPPHPDRVPALVDDLVAFANRVDLPALVQAAIVHAQFEVVHPFTDGNGRVGRALIQLVLRRRGLIDSATLPVATGLLASVDEYFARLRTYKDDGDVNGFVLFFAFTAHQVAIEARQSALRLATFPVRWQERLHARRGSTAARMLAHLLAHPVLTAATVTELAGVTTRRAYDAVDRLTEVGILEEVTGGRRNRVWQVPDVFDEVDAFEQRVGVRSAPGSARSARSAR